MTVPPGSGGAGDDGPRVTALRAQCADERGPRAS